MSMSGAGENEMRTRRTRHPVALAIGIGCYVLVVISGMFALLGHVGPVLLAPLWIVHGVVLVLALRKLGARESSTYTTLFIVATSLMSVYVADMARDDLTLQHRGDKITATVVRKWRDPAEGRKARDYHYELRRQDGSPVAGPAMSTPSGLYTVGQTITVIVDPKGEIGPKTPGQADATGEELGSAAFALGAVGAVAWMAWRGSNAVRRRSSSTRGKAARAAYRVLGRNRASRDEQEEELRSALRTYPSDRRGYIRVHPEDYPDVSLERAARIARDLGLRAEGAGNRGSWRFSETVIEEVPHD